MLPTFSVVSDSLSLPRSCLSLCPVEVFVRSKSLSCLVLGVLTDHADLAALVIPEGQRVILTGLSYVVSCALSSALSCISSCVLYGVLPPCFVLCLVL